MRAFGKKDSGNRLQQNPQIKKERGFLNVIDFQINPVRIIDIAAAGHLPPARHAGLDRKKLLPIFIIFDYFIHHDRARTHQRHAAGQHVEKLGKFVQAGLTQKGSDGRDARIVIPG